MTYILTGKDANNPLYGIIRVNFGSIEWVKLDGGGWSLTTKSFKRAIFMSRTHAEEVLSDIQRLLSWGDDTLVVVPVSRWSVTGQTPEPSPNPDESYMVLRVSEIAAPNGYTITHTEYLIDGCDTEKGWALSEDVDQRWIFDTFDEAKEAIEAIGDKFLIIAPIAPKPLSPAAIESGQFLVSELLRLTE